MGIRQGCYVCVKMGYGERREPFNLTEGLFLQRDFPKGSLYCFAENQVAVCLSFFMYFDEPNDLVHRQYHSSTYRRSI